MMTLSEDPTWVALDAAWAQYERALEREMVQRDRQSRRRRRPPNPRPDVPDEGATP
jgi:hypothetical protein